MKRNIAEGISKAWAFRLETQEPEELSALELISEHPKDVMTFRSLEGRVHTRYLSKYLYKYKKRIYTKEFGAIQVYIKPKARYLLNAKPAQLREILCC